MGVDGGKCTAVDAVCFSIMGAQYSESMPGPIRKNSRRGYRRNGFLANVATDSWYVLIWAENGAIGLTLHFIVLFFIVGKGTYYIMFRNKHEEMNTRMKAILASIMGILMANYGNAVMGQFPTSINTYYGMAFLFLAPHYDKILLEAQKNGKDLLKVLPNTKLSFKFPS